jgi:hypothetical protein
MDTSKRRCKWIKFEDKYEEDKCNRAPFTKINK